MTNRAITYVPKGVLRRKFAVPALPVSYVREERMTGRVLDVGSWRVCLVPCAPGCGKTSLLAQWHGDFAARGDCVALWMSLDAQDRDGLRFMRALCALLQQVDDSFVQITGQFDQRDDLEAMRVDLANLVDETCDPNLTYIVFMDDYEEAASDELDEAILFMNRFAPENFRFVLAGVSFSPAIDDIVLQSPVIECTWRELITDEERMRAFAFSVIEGLTEDQYGRYRAMFGRWPMAFVFIGLARRRATSEGAVLKMVKGYCQRYFDKEVISCVTPVEHTFMIETSLLDELRPEACDFVTQRECSREMLESLCARNCFVSYDVASDTFSYGPAFRLYLRDKLLALHKSQVSALAARANEWFDARDMTCEKAKYLVVASDPFFIEETIYHSNGLRRPESRESFTAYALECPASWYEKDPLLMWASIWGFISAGMVRDARRVVECAANSDVDRDGYAFDYASAICCALEGDSETSLRTIRSIISQLGSDIPRVFQCLLIHMEGENCERLGHLQESRDLFLRALSLAERVDGAFFKLFDLYLLSRHFWYLGDFEKAVEMATRGLASCGDSSELFGGFQATLACVHIERNELEEACHCLARAEKHLTPNSNIDMYVDFQIARARYEAARDNSIEAYEILAEVVRIMGERAVPRNVGFEAKALFVSLAARLGEVSSMRRFEDPICAFGSDQDVFRAVICLFAKARTQWAEGDRSGCLSTVRAARARIEASDLPSNYLLAEAYVMESSVYAQSGDKTRAMVSLSKAIELSMRGGFLNVFREGEDPLRDLLVELVTSRKTSFAIRDYAKKVLSAFGDLATTKDDIAFRQGDVQGYYALTSREREILHLLNQGMSRQELAHSLGISQNTAKSHLKNIYAKLGVHTRAEAYRASCEGASSMSAPVPE